MDNTIQPRIAELQQSLRHWKTIIAQYQRANTGRAIGQLFTSFGPFVAIWVLMYFAVDYSLLLTLALGLVNAFFLVRIFIIQHDCGHFSFLASRKKNEVVGFVCSFFSSIPYTYWARVHSFHHGHTGQLEHRHIGDINFLTTDEYRDLRGWGRLQYRVFRNPFVLFFIVPVVYFVLMLRIPRVNFPGWAPTIRKQNINNLLILGAYAALGYLLGWRAFLIVQGSIILFFSIIAFWFFYVQHQHDHTYMQWTKNWDYLTAAIKGATFYKLPRIMHFLTGNIGYHHIHHLSSRIPNYNLRRCARENPVLQEYVTQLTFWKSLPMMFNKLWDEDGQRMISFREFNRSEQERLAA